MPVLGKDCFQNKTGYRVPCRVNPTWFPEGKNGPCPMPECMAEKIFYDQELLQSMFGAEFTCVPPILKLKLLFHYICPGTNNVSADPDIIHEHTEANPVFKY